MKIQNLPLLLIPALLAFSLPGQAASSTASNIFSGATATASSTHSGGFSPAFAVDGSGTTEFFFTDGGSSFFFSLSGFSAPLGIDSITFFDGNNTSGRASNAVTIYTSTTSQTSLNPSNYTALNGGTPFTLATNGAGGASTAYTDGLDSAGSGHGYDTLTGLNIPTGTQSILFQFAQPTPGGTGVSEIEAFAGTSAPEPSSWALFLGGAVALAFARRLLPADRSLAD